MAERHARIVLYSIVPWFAVAIVLGAISPRLALLALPLVVVEHVLLRVFLSRRFVDALVGANLAVELSGRRPSGEVLAHHGWFVANAFVATPPYMLVSADDGTVFGQPNLAYHRPGSQVVASASLVGVQFASLLTDGRWLVTSSGPVIAHPQLVVQRAPAADAGDVYWTHRDGLEILARRGLDEVDHGLAPLDVVLTLERIEQNRLRAHRDAGGSLWSLAREAQRGNAGTLADGAAVELAA